MDTRELTACHGCGCGVLAWPDAPVALCDDCLSSDLRPACQRCGAVVEPEQLTDSHDETSGRLAEVCREQGCTFTDVVEAAVRKLRRSSLRKVGAPTNPSAEPNP